MHCHWTKNGRDDVLVMLHGFMGDSRAFTRLTDEMDILRIDLPGHGQDESDMDTDWSFDWLIQQLAVIITGLKGSYQHIALYGYSMGGRVALYYALHYTVDALILESASPGLESAEERQARQQVDTERGDALVQDYEAFVSRWERLPLFTPAAPLSSAAAECQHQMRSSQRPSRLAKALRDYGTGSQPNLWPRLKELDAPVLLLTGTQDYKFKMINQRMAQSIRHSRHIEVSAGHSIHVEHPEIFDTIVLEFIKEAYHV
ncbi:2-succinyl-6-hydroxy-2,4-cyclohexadiene-1-carboxylate synthase [Macrococcus carouselicus]|uniref:Putative 2-succinyl-6-hydroxy-2,4-cyclohexadiene-1-carboxylate synthase n=1 Tax=Macrococcus carouselicus TaxID=69969 RepID=A0A9Q8CNW5_9STAP|nr:2-succinyl-6-hydroxy-2,4-cyclohexadiene-1-carboxylate synthase [Macrococcus carouselicus]TDM04636.1 2-succinyl-6-hydroxy-2,4-cyclohexadiene-1-carboxylate synthase [Macrococcus carouselicus]